MTEYIIYDHARVYSFYSLNPTPGQGISIKCCIPHWLFFFLLKVMVFWEDLGWITPTGCSLCGRSSSLCPVKARALENFYFSRPCWCRLAGAHTLSFAFELHREDIRTPSPPFFWDLQGFSSALGPLGCSGLGHWAGWTEYRKAEGNVRL